MALVDLDVKRAKPAEKPYRLPDSGGLFLWVTKGGKFWRLRQRVGRREQTLSLGEYPEISLLTARVAADALKKDAKRAAKQAKSVGIVGTGTGSVGIAHPPDAVPVPTFEEVARDWHRVQSPRWAERHARKTLESLETTAFPAFGNQPITKVTAPMVLKMIRAIEAREAPEHARKVRQRVSAVFVYAIASGQAENDPAAVIKGALGPQKKKHQPAIVELAPARAVLAKLDTVPARPVTRLAMRLLALTALRQGELRKATWAEFEGLDGPEPVWRVPGPRMKMKIEHVVPLSRQAVETIAALRMLTGRGPLPFPGASDTMRPMSENALSDLLERAGYKGMHVPHGWRSSFSTIMNERFPDDRASIDLMLAHQPKDAVERAYNRATLMPRRRQLAQLWADLIAEGLLPPAALADLPRR